MRSVVFHKTSVQVFLILLLGLIIYSNTFSAPFIFDDDPNILNNPAIKDFQYFLEPSRVLGLPLLPGVRYTFQTRIVGYFSFFINYALHGFSVSGYHITNLAIHLINGLFVYTLVMLTFKTPYYSFQTGSPLQAAMVLRKSKMLAFTSALLFVCHPIQTEAVTYIVQRFTSLAVFFYLTTLIFYISSRLSQKPLYRHLCLAISLVSSVLAMFVKEFSMTLPLVIFLYECTFFSERAFKKIQHTLPYVLSGALIPARLVISTISANRESISETLHVITGDPSLSRSQYLATQFRALMTYMRLLLFPVNQNLDYDYPVHGFFTLPVALSLLVVLIMLALAVYFYYRSGSVESIEKPVLRLVSFGIFWFFLTLSAESGIIPIADSFFEHRLYLPSVGFFLVIGVAITEIISNQKRMVVFPVIIVLLLSVSTHKRNAVWNSDIRMWEDAVKKSPQKARPRCNLGSLYGTHGKFAESIRESKAAIDLSPRLALAHANLGEAYWRTGRNKEAIQELTTAVSINPSLAGTHFILGNVFRDENRFDDAAKEYRAVIMLDPSFPDARKNLALVSK